MDVSMRGERKRLYLHDYELDEIVRSRFSGQKLKLLVDCATPGDYDANSDLSKNIF